MKQHTNQLVWAALKQQNHQTVIQLSKTVDRAEITIYAALNRAVKAGVISKCVRDPLPQKGRREHIYSII
jgi:predicted transcriptional regulator